MTTGPKWSRGSLDAIDNTYVVRNNLLFEYYPISVKPYTVKDNFIRLEISPGIMSEGVACVHGNMYDVSLKDLLRRRINVGKRQVYQDLFDSDNTATGTKRKRKEAGGVEANSDQQGPSGLFRDEVGKAPDVAWEDQVQSLLQAISAEEGEDWEITGTTQSGPIDESSAIPDIFEDT